jgi:hypothetical protein
VEPHSGVLNDYLVVEKAHSGVVEPHPRVLDAYPVVVKAQLELWNLIMES